MTTRRTNRRLVDLAIDGMVLGVTSSIAFWLLSALTTASR